MPLLINIIEWSIVSPC